MAIYITSNFLYGDNFEVKRGTLIIEDGIIYGITNEHIPINKNHIKYGGYILPPLINCHTHVGDTGIKDIGINKNLDDIVKPPNGLKHRYLSNISDEKLITTIYHGIEEIFNGGSSYFCDFRENGLEGIKILNKSYEKYRHNKGVYPIPIVLGRPTLKEHNIKVEIKNILNYSHGINLSGCNEYDNDILKYVGKMTKKYNKLFSIHANEHKGSVKYSLNKYGMTEIERISNLKLNPSFIIHATHTSENDLDIIEEQNIPVVVCPRANASFNVGLPNINELFNRTLIGIGTDNIMANSPSIFREMDFIYKIYHIEPTEILRFATENGAKILGIPKLGLIKEGYIGKSLTFVSCNPLRYSKNSIASIITRCEYGDSFILNLQ